MCNKILRGTSASDILRDIIIPNTLKEISYEGLLNKVKEYFSPRPSEIVKRFKFQNKLRKERKAIADFVRDLRRLSELCNFGNALNDLLCDQLALEIQEGKIQQKLLNSENLTFQIAVEIVESFESAEVGVKSLHIEGGTNVNEVCAVRMDK